MRQNILALNTDTKGARWFALHHLEVLILTAALVAWSVNFLLMLVGFTLDFSLVQRTTCLVG